MSTASRILPLALLGSAACLAIASPTAAQRTISHDILTGETPTALTCGFCAGERFGVVFRELPGGAHGLNPADFPIQLDAVQLAVASADVIGSSGSFTCRGSTLGGTASLDLTIYAGETLPEGSITDLSETEPWPGETIIWEGVKLPIERSAADAPGSSSYEVNFNELRFAMGGDPPILIEAPNVYVRVVVTLTPGTDLTSASCDAIPLNPPSAYPLRDDDGVIADERAFIYAEGVGWLWNEDSGIGGDWGVRIEVTDFGTGLPDAGPTTRDAGTHDGGATDGGGGADAGGAYDPGGGGCECGIASTTRSPGAALGLGVLFALVAIRRSRRRP